MRINPLTDYGKSVKKRLIEIDKSQEWLIQEVAEMTGMFIDSSLLNKIMTGKSNSQVIKSAIESILNGNRTPKNAEERLNRAFEEIVEERRTESAQGE